MINSKIIAVIFILCCSPAFADQTIFQCQTTNNKVVQVQLRGNNVSYTFGKNLLKPELSFSAPKNEVQLFQSEDGRPQIGNSLGLNNGNIQYEVASSTVVATGYTEVNITVYQDGEVLTKIDCNKKKNIINKLSDISPIGFKEDSLP